MPGVVETALRDIDDRLRELQDELSRLEPARSAVTGARRRPGRSRGTTSRTTRSLAPRARTARRGATAAPARFIDRNGNTRAPQTLGLVRQRLGNTIPQIAEAMKIQPNDSFPRAAAACLRRTGQARR